MVRKLQEVKTLSPTENKAVIHTVRQLMKQNGYTYHELSRRSGVSVGGLVGIRKETRVSPNVASKVAQAFEFKSWKQMIGISMIEQSSSKTDTELSKQVTLLEKRVNLLERQLIEMYAQLGIKMGHTNKNV